MTDATVSDGRRSSPRPEPERSTADPAAEDAAGRAPRSRDRGHLPHRRASRAGAPRRSRTILVSDLHLPAVATTTSTAVADEIAAVLGTCHGPGAFVIAGDGFEMLAGPPDVGMILDAHPQFTEAVARVRRRCRPSRRRALRQPRRPAGLGRCGRSRSEGPAGRRAVRPQLRPRGGYRARAPAGPGGPRQPVGSLQHLRGPMVTGGHPVRPPRGPRPAPRARVTPVTGSLLEGVQWLDGDVADFMGSRLFYRKVVGKLWLVAIPFVAILLLRLLSFLPGMRGILHHHAQRWLLGFGLLVAFMVIVAAVAAVATLLRVNRALRETAVSARSDPASHNAPPRAEAARLVTQGYAGMISGHTHEPELSVVGNGFYANTGSGTASVVARKSRFRLPHPFVTVHRFSYVEIVGGVGARGPALGPGGAGPGPRFCSSAWPWRRSKVDTSTTTLVGSLPDGPTWPLDDVGLKRWVVRAPGPAEWPPGSCSSPGVLNVVFAAAVARHLHPGGRPLASLRHPSALGVGVDRRRTGAVRPGPGGAPGLATGVAGHALRAAGDDGRPPDPGPPARGCRPSPWSSACGCCSSISTSGSSPSGVSRLFVWMAAGGLVVIAATAGVGNLFGQGHREPFRPGVPPGRGRGHSVPAAVGGAARGASHAGPVPPGRRHSKGPEASSSTTVATPSTTSPSGTTSRGSSPASRSWPIR